MVFRSIKRSSDLRLTAPIVFLCCALAFICHRAESKINNGNFHCFCPPGSYEVSSVNIYASSNICDANEKVEFSNLQEVTNPKILVRLKTCEPCYQSCLECVGSGENFCLKCAKGYVSVEQPAAEDENFLKSEQLLKHNSLETVEDEEMSGDGPIETQQRLLQCVSVCPTNFYLEKNSSCLPISKEKYKAIQVNESMTHLNLSEEEEDKPIPAGYYAIPPLVILGVIGVFVFTYIRKKRRESNNNNWKAESRVIKAAGSAESKTFLTTTRQGNAYVYVDRPLPHPGHQLHPGHHGGSMVSCWSAYDDDPDSLYETPDHRKHHHHHHRGPPNCRHHPSDNIDKARSKSLDGLHHNVKHQVDKPRTQKPRSGSLESNHLPQHVKKVGTAYYRDNKYSDPMDVPSHHAPPAPIRHLPASTKRRVHNDHIYVNVEDHS